MRAKAVGPKSEGDSLAVGRPKRRLNAATGARQPTEATAVDRWVRVAFPPHCDSDARRDEQGVDALTSPRDRAASAPLSLTGKECDCRCADPRLVKCASVQCGSIGLGRSAAPQAPRPPCPVSLMSHRDPGFSRRQRPRHSRSRPRSSLQRFAGRGPLT
jgi:hypothetical protein